MLVEVQDMCKSTGVPPEWAFVIHYFVSVPYRWGCSALVACQGACDCWNWVVLGARSACALCLQ